MPLPGKDQGFPGNSVPKYGQSEIRPDSTSINGLTLTLASGASSGSAPALVVREFVTEGASGTAGQEFFSVGYAGLRAGRIVVRDAATASANETGGWGSTTLTISASQAGGILVVPTASAAGGAITLPKASGVPLGTQFSFYFSTTANASGIRISSTLSASNDVVLVGGATGVAFQVTATGLQNHAYIDVVKIGAQRWLGLPGGSTAAAWSATGGVA